MNTQWSDDYIFARLNVYSDVNRRDTMRVMFIGAHPDDFECYCAGTFAKYAKQGHELYVAIATNGNIGSHVLQTKEEVAAIRHQEALNALSLIGAKLIWMGFDDEYLIDTPEVRDAFIDAVREAKPDVIFTTRKNKDYNPDHDITGYMAFIARINATIPLIKTKHEPTSKIPPMFFCQPSGMMDFVPDYYVDISEEMETRVAMWKCHKSQCEEWGDATFKVDTTRSKYLQAERWAYQTGAGIKYAEAFELCKTWPIGCAEPHKMLP